MSGRDITEGRGDSSGYARSIAVDLNVAQGTTWTNTGVAYDCAIAGIPFLMAINDQRPYERATTPFRKQQFDSQRDPGEQSLTTWWLRSQSSFHAGEGINFYDPYSNPYSTTLGTNSYRYKASLGVDPFDTEGEVSLLRRMSKTQNTTSGVKISTVTVNGNDRILMHDDSKLLLTDGSTSAMTTLSAGVATTIYASTNDGVSAYYVDASHIVKVPLTGGATSAVRNLSMTVTNSVMNYVKQRLVVGINNSIYEVPVTAGAGAMPSPVFTHPNSSWVWTSITEGGSAIYASGYAGSNSAVFKFVLDTSGAMPTLTSAITAAVMPDGEVIHETFVHLMSYMAIGTNKGVRVGRIEDQTGNITYGPLIIKTERPVRAFAAHNSYIYCASSLSDVVPGEDIPGLYIMDLATEIDNLRYAYATHVYTEDNTAGEIIDVCHLGKTDQLAFIVGPKTNSVNNTANAGLYVQSATELYPSGWIETGLIRYNTLETKNFKRIVGRGEFTYGSMSIQSRALAGDLYDIISYDNAIGSPEATITQPIGAQEALGLRFVLYRDSADNTKGSILKGYQLKAVPASPRSRIIKVPLLNFDSETDKYNTTAGYEGRAYDRLAALEHAEENGDIVVWQDFRIGETNQCLIEEVAFTDITPPDKKLTGFGGIITLTIRTV